MTPYQRACKNSLDVQDACNISGVLHSFLEDLAAVRAHPGNSGTDWIRRHPVVVLYVDKLFDMVGRPEYTDYAHAHDYCRDVLDQANANHPSEASACPTPT